MAIVQSKFVTDWTVFGLTSIRSVDGSTIVRRSIEMGEPVVFVSMNHR